MTGSAQSTGRPIGRPRLAVPMHFNSNEKIRVDPHAFAANAARAGHTVRVMTPGESLDL